MFFVNMFLIKFLDSSRLRTKYILESHCKILSFHIYLNKNMPILID